MLNAFTRPLNSLWSAGKSTGRTVLLTSLVITAGFAGLRHVGTVLESLEVNVRDRMIRFQGEAPPDQRLLVVGVTEQDIRKYGYPLSDGTLATLLTTLEKQQPRAIGLDIIRDIAQGTGREQLLQTFQQYSNLIGVCKVGVGEDAGYPPPPGVDKSQLGFSNFPPDPGGVVRRGMLAMVPPPPQTPADKNPCQDPAEPLFSLGFQVAQVYLQQEGIPLDFTPNDEIQFGKVILSPLAPNSGGYQQTDAGGYQTLLQYRSADQVVPRVTLTQVLTGQVPADQIRDRIILIGYTAESVHDLFPTPYSAGQRDNQPMPGVVIHAQLASQILSTVLNGAAQPWFWSEWLELAWIGAWVLAGGVLAGSVRHPLGLGMGSLVALGLCTGTGYLAFLQAGWIPVGTPAIAFLTTLSSVILVDRYAQTIAKQIKGFLKLDIEIDEAEKENAVAEITESDYFQKLQESSEKLKRPKDDSTAAVTREEKQPQSQHKPASKTRPASRRDILGELQEDPPEVLQREDLDISQPVSSNQFPPDTSALDLPALQKPKSKLSTRRDVLAELQQASSGPAESSSPNSKVQPNPQRDALSELQQTDLPLEKSSSAKAAFSSEPALPDAPAPAPPTSEESLDDFFLNFHQNSQDPSDS